MYIFKMISITDFFLCDQQNTERSSYCKIIWLMSANHLTACFDTPLHLHNNLERQSLLFLSYYLEIEVHRG